MESILIVTAMILACVAVIVVGFAASLSKHEFECKKCGHKTRFKWTKLVFVTHYENEYRVKCPECNGNTMIEK